MINSHRRLPLLIVAILLAGCEEDERLAKMAQNSVEQQSKQNQEMSKLNREVVQGTKRLVESENESRKELGSLQRDIQQQLAEIDRQRSQLEDQRQQRAKKRQRESLLAPVISNVGLLIACALPLVLAWYLLHGGWRSQTSDDVNLGELLVEEIVSDRPSWLPPPLPVAAISHQQQERLNAINDFDSDEGNSDDEFS